MSPSFDLKLSATDLLEIIAQNAHAHEQIHEQTSRTLIHGNRGHEIVFTFWRVISCHFRFYPFSWHSVEGPNPLHLELVTHLCLTIGSLLFA